MGAFIVKQPNGKYCRFSTIVDCPTDWNMTEEDHIQICMEKAKEEALKTLNNIRLDFKEVLKLKYQVIKFIWYFLNLVD